MQSSRHQDRCGHVLSSLLSPLHMDFVYFCRRPKLWRDTHKLEFKTIILSPSVTSLFWETVTTNMHGLEKYTSNIMQCLIYTQMNSIEIYWIFLEILLTCIANLGLYSVCVRMGGGMVTPSRYHNIGSSDYNLTPSSSPTSTLPLSQSGTVSTAVRGDNTQWCMFICLPIQ